MFSHLSSLKMFAARTTHTKMYENVVRLLLVNAMDYHFLD